MATTVSKDGHLNKLSVEQTVSRPDENFRIVQAGGNVLGNKLDGQLDVSRAFGDRDLKNFVLNEPETHTYQIK